MNFSTKKIHAPDLRLKLEGWRSRFVLLGCLSAFMVLFGRAFYLQCLNSDFLQAKGEARFVRVMEMPAARGAVTDRNGKMLAISTPMDSIKANLSDLDADPAQVGQLAKLLEFNKADLDT